MRIVHLANHSNHGHGNVHVGVDLACAQASRGHHVVFASKGGDYDGLLQRHGVVGEMLEQDQRRPIPAALAALRLVGIVRRHRIDIVHAHMMSGALLGFVAARLTGRPLVTSVHNSFDRHSRLMRLGTRVAAVSSAERDLLISKGYRPERVEVVLNGPLDSARELTFLDDAPPPVDRPCVTTVCGLHGRKGVDILIRAFAEASRDRPDWHLTIVGEGPDRAMLEELARSVGLGARARFLGSIKSPKSVLERSEIFAMASFQEPFGLALAEARAAGCAIVATAVGGMPEVLDGGEAGLLVPAGDQAALTDRLRLLMTDDRLRAEWRAKARSGAERFRAERMADDYDRLYARVLPQR